MSKPAKEIKTKKVKWLIPSITVLVFLLLTLATIYFRKDPSLISDTPTSPTPIQEANLIKLPSPALKSSVSVESAIQSRRVKRSFADEQVSLKSVSQLLWSAQGITVEWGDRTAPSAKSTYPLTVYLIVSKVEGLNPGQYVYQPGERTPIHSLKPIKEGDFGEAIFQSLNQNSFKGVPGIFVIAGDMDKMAAAFGGIAHDKDVYIEAGHVAQNLYLQAETLKLGMAANSNFNEGIIRSIISIPDNETVIYLIPFGVPKD